MRVLISGSVFAAAMLASLPSLAGSMEPRFGNTMIASRPDGTVMKLYYNADKSFTGNIQPAGAPMTISINGTWRQDGDKLCVQPAAGPGGAMPPESCAELKGDHVGDTWETTVKGLDGEPVVQTVTIVKGR
mgnify:FL=1